MSTPEGQPNTPDRQWWLTGNPDDILFPTLQIAKEERPITPFDWAKCDDPTLSDRALKLATDLPPYVRYMLAHGESLEAARKFGR
jgi:hypothetical protein